MTLICINRFSIIFIIFIIHLASAAFNILRKLNLNQYLLRIKMFIGLIDHFSAFTSWERLVTERSTVMAAALEVPQTLRLTAVAPELSMCIKAF